MTVDEAMDALQAADTASGFQKMTERQRILNEVADAAFRRGQESMLPFLAESRTYESQNPPHLG